jgi:hypothetical protein
VGHTTSAFTVELFCCCCNSFLQGFALALKLGTTKQQLDSLVGIHPTSAEEVLGLKGPFKVYKQGKQQQQDGQQGGKQDGKKRQEVAAGQGH